MKKLPILATMLLVVGVVASLAFTHPISSQNGVVRGYSVGATLTLDTSSGPHTYILRNSTLMWGWGATSFVANTGGSGNSSNSSGSSSSSSSGGTTSSTAAATTAATATPAATATTTGGTGGTGTTSGSGSSSTTTTGTNGAVSNVNGLGAGARVTVFAQCFSGSTFRHRNSSQSTGNNNGQNNVCFALAVIVRSPMAGTIANTGGNNGANATSTTSTGTGAVTTTETPAAVTTETPAVTMTPTP